MLRLFGSDNIAHIMDRLGMGEDDPIEHKMITKSIENAQKKVEGRNFDMRKHVLEYDDVMNQQRKVIYSERRKVLSGDNLRDHIMNMIDGIIEAEMNQYANEKLYPEEWTLDGLIKDAESIYAPKDRMTVESLEEMSRDEIQEFLHNLADEAYKQREELFGEENMRELEKIIMLRVVDNRWMEHLDRMDMLREGIGLLAYGQRNPLVEYKIKSHDMFGQMIDTIQSDIASLMFRVNIITQEQQEAMERESEQRLAAAKATHGDDSEPAEAQKKKPVKNTEKIGRNDPCPCGSGKKYKNCCGRDK